MNLDTAIHYRSRGGDKVTIHEIVLKNCLGKDVMFPVKCSIRPNRPRARSRYQILTLEGRASIFGEHKDDIIGEWETGDARSNH